jgi:RNA polymerase sigma-70 factor (ECF subfamily)
MVTGEVPVAVTMPAAGAVAGDAVSDDQLMAAFCRGDEAAFELLYGRHAQAVLAFLRRMVRQPDLAEDVLQMTFLSVVRARGRYRPGTNVRGWIYTIAANAARDALRRARVRREEPSADAAVAAPLVDHGAEVTFGDPAVRARLEEAIDALPPDQKEAVILHKVEGLSFQEIADILQISAGAAKVRAHRGYEKLRVMLKKEDMP